VLSAVVLCEGEEGLCAVDGDTTLSNRLTDFLLELIACGVRNLFLLCSGGCRGICAAVGKASLPPPPSTLPPPSEWSYSETNKDRLSNFLAFRSIASTEELERDLREALREISCLSNQRDGCCPVLVATVSHSEATRGVSSTQTLYQLLASPFPVASEPRRSETLSREGLAVMARLLPLADPESDTASFLSAIREKGGSE
jgi:hypothetical protein